jgi:terminase small subunit-like protein
MAGAKVEAPIKAKAKMGRPTDYNDTIATLICDRVATHTVGLNKLCEMYDELPSKFTVNLWRYKHHDFSIRYAQAKLFQADLLAEECLEIADDSTYDTLINPEGFEVCNTEFIARSRLRIDTRKWLAAKLLPKQYGPVVAEDKKTVSESIVEKLIDRLID